MKLANNKSVARPQILFRGIPYTNQEIHTDESDPHNIITEHVFGHKSLEYLDPATNRWTRLSPDDDKFLITSETLALARSEFWHRWSIYLHRRFGIRFAYIIESN